MSQSHIFDDQHRWEQVPDEEIVQRVRSGEIGLFDILIYRYRRRLYATVLGVVRNRDDAEDVVQMACFKTYTHLHQYEGRAPFWVWMHRIAMFQALTHKQAAQRYSPIEEDHVWRDNSTPEVQYGHQERDAALKSAIDGLSHHDRKILNLHHLEELSINEIACLMAVTPLRVRVWLFRARQKLRKKLISESLFNSSRRSGEYSSLHY